MNTQAILELESQDGLFDLPWPMIPLGEVIRQRKEFIVIDDATTYKRPRVQVRAQGLLLRDEVLGSTIRTKRQQLCKTNDFLVAEIDAKVGGFGLVPTELEGAIVSSHYYLFEVDTSQLDPEFLDYAIKMPGFLAQIEARGSTNYASIRAAQVLTYTIPFPPLPEQRAIAASLRAAREARDASANVLEQTRELKRSLLRHLFTYGPVSVQEAGNVELQETEIGMIPVGWGAVIVSKHFRIASGTTPSRANEAYWGGDIPWVKTGEIKYNIITSPDEKVTSLAVEETSLKLFPKGTLLMAMYGQGVTRGRVAILGQPATINQACAAFIPKDDSVYNRYLYYFMEYNYENIREKSHGTQQMNLNARIVGNLYFPKTDVETQVKIVVSLDALEDNFMNRQESLNQKISICDSMLNDLLTGRIRVAVPASSQEGSA